MKPVHPAGLLLTGGASRRMGRDKSQLDVGGVGLAARVARVLGQVAYPVLAVGPEAGTGLFSVEDVREGPLAAFAAGMGALAVRGHDGPALLVACDLPLIEAPLLRFLADSLGAADAVVPVVQGRDQPLCACYAPRAASVAARLAGAGSLAMRDLLDALDAVKRVPENEWDHIAPARALLDVDTPDQLDDVRRILDDPA